MTGFIHYLIYDIGISFLKKYYITIFHGNHEQLLLLKTMYII